MREMLRACYAALAVAICGGCIVGCISDGTEPRGHAELPSPAREQLATYKALVNYLGTADPQYRIQVEDAYHEREILASRIFRAFSWYRDWRNPHDSHFEAKVLLLENPRLTLRLLRPVVDEPLEKGPPSDEDYLDLCANVARIEQGSTARGILRDVSRSSNERVARRALRLLNEIEGGDNYRAKSRSYRGSEARRDLEWFAFYYLQQGMPRHEVEAVLGEPYYDNRDEYVCAYRGKSGSEYSYLWMAYCGFLQDPLLDWWSWGEDPSEHGPPRESTFPTTEGMPPERRGF